MTWDDLAHKVLASVPIVVGRSPPTSWFSTGDDVLGVDWEGQPPALVQIACKHGIALDIPSAPWVRGVLTDARFTHAVFGAHELPLVANGFDCQPGDKPSLVEMTSRLLCPSVRLLKDPTIHQRVDWTSSASHLPEEAIRYAALDAWVTRRIALRLR